MLSLLNVFIASMSGYLGNNINTNYSTSSYVDYFSSVLFFDLSNANLKRTTDDKEIRISFDKELCCFNNYFDSSIYEAKPDVEKDDYIGSKSRIFYSETLFYSFYVDENIITNVGTDFLKNLTKLNFSFKVNELKFDLRTDSFSFLYKYTLDVNMEFAYLSPTRDSIYTTALSQSFNGQFFVNPTPQENSRLYQLLNSYFNNADVSHLTNTTFFNGRHITFEFNNYYQVYSFLKESSTNFNTGYDKGFSDGYNQGFNENPNLVNPFSLVFSGINKILSIEIFPNFKLLYVVGFGLFVGLLIFILGFFK